MKVEIMLGVHRLVVYLPWIKQWIGIGWNDQ